MLKLFILLLTLAPVPKELRPRFPTLPTASDALLREWSIYPDKWLDYWRHLEKLYTLRPGMDYGGIPLSERFRLLDVVRSNVNAK